MISYLKFLALTCLLPLGLFAQNADPMLPVKVEVRPEGNGFKLYRGGEPYYIKGVGGQVYLDRAAAYGANTLRTWGADDAIKVLDEAQAKSLTVLFGLWVGQERQGFDYNDTKAVKAQFAYFQEVVRAYKNHPAILMWGIGNENDLAYTNFNVWNAINDIARMVHEEDPNHPTMTVTAGLDVAEVQLIKDRAPEIDIYGINTYGGLIGVDKQIRNYGWEGPYIITEWGPSGHWEVAKTQWGAAVEQNSSEKAEVYLNRYRLGIERDPERCLGSYVFLWGQKQETTPTWYGVFLETGEETEVMDVLEHIWTGKWPENRAPHLDSYTLNGKKPEESVYVRPGALATALAEIKEPEGEKLSYTWEILASEQGLTGSGGDAENRPQAVPVKVIRNENGHFEFRAPRQAGAYRLFMYARDGHGNVATANFPFYAGYPPTTGLQP